MNLRLVRTALTAGGVLLTVPIALVGAVAGGLTQLPEQPAPSRLADTDIPVDLLAVYRQAAAGCAGLSWPVLAAVGKLGSDHNRHPAEVSGTVSDGSGGLGLMQLPAYNWGLHAVDGNADGSTDPTDPVDAIPTAGSVLCALGAGRDTPAALAAYHCDPPQELAPQIDADCLARARAPGGYVSAVLDWASRYSEPLTAGGSAATIAVQVALGQVGTPYLWGGESPGIGFDCSGLVQHAYTAAGITLPRTAQAQYDLGPLLPTGTDPAAGDLVFFGTSATHVTHVGIALGQGRMVDAPHTGAQVRVEPIAGFGRLLAASRPAARAPSSSSPTGALS